MPVSLSVLQRPTAVTSRWNVKMKALWHWCTTNVHVYAPMGWILKRAVLKLSKKVCISRSSFRVNQKWIRIAIEIFTFNRFPGRYRNHNLTTYLEMYLRFFFFFFKFLEISPSSKCGKTLSAKYHTELYNYALRN